MKKKMICRAAVAFVLCLGVILSFPAQYFAASTSEVTYSGSAKKFIFIPDDSDLFQNFKGLMPGDSATQTITVKNDASSNVDVIIYLRAETVDAQYKNFLDQLSMTVKWNGKTELFNAAPSQTAGLTKDVELGEFKSGGSGTLDVTLNVPASLGNEYQNAEGHVVWIFTVVEKDAPPKNGDTSPVVPVACAFAVCATLCVVLLAFRRKNQKEDTSKA